MSLYTSADNIRTDSSSDDRTSRGYTCFCLNTIAENMLKKQVRGLVKELHISFIDYFFTFRLAERFVGSLYSSFWNNESKRCVRWSLKPTLGGISSSWILSTQVYSNKTVYDIWSSLKPSMPVMRVMDKFKLSRHKLRRNYVTLRTPEIPVFGCRLNGVLFSSFLRQSTLFEKHCYYYGSKIDNNNLRRRNTTAWRILLARTQPVLIQRSNESNRRRVTFQVWGLVSRLWMAGIYGCTYYASLYEAYDYTAHCDVRSAGQLLTVFANAWLGDAMRCMLSSKCAVDRPNCVLILYLLHGSIFK